MSIKVIEKPSVYLVGQSGMGYDLDGFLAENGSPDWNTDAQTSAELLVECAGRLCYQSFTSPRPGGNAAYISRIIEQQHGSVLEHSVYSLIFTGVSRSLTHELVRHRTLSYSQLSQRYVDESDVAFVIPPKIASDCSDAFRDGHVAPQMKAQLNRRRWLSSVSVALDAYRSLSEDLEDPSIADKTIRRKTAREAARSVLPNCTETKIFVTGNGRSWRNFLEQRGSAFADAEIRRLALATLPVLNSASPNIFADYRVESIDGKECIATKFRKV